MSLTKGENILQIIREVDRISAGNLRAAYRARYGEITNDYFERCIERLKQERLIVSVKKGVYQLTTKHQEQAKRDSIGRLYAAMRSRSTAPPKIRATKDIPFVYWKKIMGFGTRGEDRVVIIQAGAVAQYDAASDMYLFGLQGEVFGYRRWTVQQMHGFFDEP